MAHTLGLGDCSLQSSLLDFWGSALDGSCREIRMSDSRFRGGLVFKAHRLVYHSTLGSRVIKETKKIQAGGHPARREAWHAFYMGYFAYKKLPPPYQHRRALGLALL